MTDYKVIPDNIYPARGRKPCKTFAKQIALALHSRQYLPRKGTETSTLSSLDTNRRLEDSRQYLPRKGTET